MTLIQLHLSYTEYTDISRNGATTEILVLFVRVCGVNTQLNYFHRGEREYIKIPQTEHF